MKACHFLKHKHVRSLPQRYQTYRKRTMDKKQTEYLIKPFRDGVDQLEFEILSNEITILPKGSKVVIKKQNEFKSTSCGDNRISNCFEINKVTDFIAKLFR